eukprot:COSAG01_NODE_14764_length_1413_cov_1.624049_1_plen_104_part_01
MAAAVGAGDAGRLIQAAHTAHARVEQCRAEEDAADAAEEQRPGVVGVQPVGREHRPDRGGQRREGVASVGNHVTPPAGYLLSQVAGGVAADRFGGKPVMTMALV